MNETQRKRRGHAFMPPKAVLGKIPPLYGTEDVAIVDKIVWVHYFCAAGDWYLAELSEEDHDFAFGYIKLASDPQGAEWGYFALSELEQVNAHGGLVIVERDLHWEPRKFSEADA